MKDKIQFKFQTLLLLALLLTAFTANGQRSERNQSHQCYSEEKSCIGKVKNQPNQKSSNSNSLGYIQANTNPVLPASYNFVEYVYAEPNDQGVCDGSINNTALINDIFLSQTHRHAIGHPLLFTIGERPVFFQVAITGSGASPDVQVTGTLDGNSLGTLCLKGPAILSADIDLNQPNMDDYFSVTLPKSWIKVGLELTVTTGNETQVLSQSDLKVRPYTELNLVNVDMDLMDYNHLPHRTPIFDDFLEELASAVPVSVVRFGHFPGTVKMPTVAANSWEGIPTVVSFHTDLDESVLNRGNLNAAAQSLLGKIQQAAGDFPNTIYFGNTLNLDPGGWGTDGNFVSYEYTDVFLHELGHAFSLPHWEWEYNVSNPSPDQHNYPYGGITADGGGRGEAWNFIQDSYEFVSPYCEDASGAQGIERSDCMQRENFCIETRPSGPGPWDGFGDFTAIAISNYIFGSEVTTGQVEYKGGMVDFQLKENPGHPRVILQNGQRAFTREPSQPQNTFAEDWIKLPGEEVMDQDVFMITGSAHVNDASFNIIYQPIQYTGTLLPTIDPTDPAMFTTLQNLDLSDAPHLYSHERDITLKVTYVDGTSTHVLVPFHSSDRVYLEEPDEPVGIDYFSVVVPGDQPICNVEMYRREFLISDADNDTPGNINDPAQNITAANFMDAAILMSTLDYSCNCPGTPGYIVPGTLCDDGNPYTINDVEDGFCNCEGTAVPACGLINNAGFTQTLAGWRWWGSEASSVNGEASITIESEFDAGFGFDFLAVEDGLDYTLTFEAYATKNRPLTVIHGAEYDFENDQEGIAFLNTVFNITTTKTQYEVTFPVTENGNNSLLEFNLSGSLEGLFIDNVCFEANCDPEDNPCDGNDSQLAVKIFLQGAYQNSAGLMRDQLRTQSLIPVTEPYSAMADFSHVAGGGESVDGLGDFDYADDNDDIVDWVFLEILDNTDAVVSTRSALLQRDGDVVDIGGNNSPVNFQGIPPGEYTVIVRHRNHIGVKSTNTVALGPDITSTYDFTTAATQAVGGDQPEIDTGIFGMWSGDVDGNGSVRYLNSVFPPTPSDALGILFDPLNNVPNATLNNYSRYDVNMDGSVRYLNSVFPPAASDALHILFNTLNNVPNSTKTTNY